MFFIYFCCSLKISIYKYINGSIAFIPKRNTPQNGLTGKNHSNFIFYIAGNQNNGVFVLCFCGSFISVT